MLAATEGSALAQPCVTDLDCNDAIACTRDECVGITNRFCFFTDLCPDSTWCDGVEICCVSPGGCGATPRGSCIQPGPQQCGHCSATTTRECAVNADCPALESCRGPDYCSEPLDRCAECLNNTHCEDNNQCTSNVCDASGRCVFNPLADNTPCIFPGICTDSPHCQAGTCVPGAEVDCVSNAPPCRSGQCVAATGQCNFSVVPDNTLCDDGDICTARDTCQVGQCIGGPNIPLSGACVDLRWQLETPSTIDAGALVKVRLFAKANGCAGGALGCPTGTQPVHSIETMFTWDPAFLALGDPVAIGEANPQDPCTTNSNCDFTCGNFVFDPYDWASSAFPKDCSGDQINAPCPSGFPANDGDGYYAAIEQLPCGGNNIPACASSQGNGLHVSTIKFRALKATAGLGPPTAIRMANCIGQTRTLVGDALTPGRDVLRSTDTVPVNITVRCRNDGDCPAGVPCTAGSCIACADPAVEVRGPRYVGITPNPGTTPVALKITGVDPTVACVSGYVSQTGVLVTTPTFLTPANWQNLVGDPRDDPNNPQVQVRGLNLVSGMQYRIQGDCNQSSPGTTLSPGVTVRMWRFGDVDNNNVVDILDATRILDGFRSTFWTIACASDTDCQFVRPYRKCDLTVAPTRCRWIYFENVDIIGSPGCQPERSISIIDVTTSLDAFRSRPDNCTGVCP